MNMNQYQDVMQRDGYISPNNPLRLFPTEIWEVIFSFVEGPHELTNLLHVTTHPCFNDILDCRKTGFLFHFVLPILAKRMEMSLEDVLKLRLVSRSWRKAVDEAYFPKLACVKQLDDVHKHRGPYHADHFVSSNCPLKMGNVIFHELSELEALLQHFEGYGGDRPLVSRSFCVGDHSHHEPDPQIPEQTRVWSLTLRFLDLYGQGITSFSFFSTTEERSGPSYYLLIRSALERLPNLEKLQLHLNVEPGHILKEHCEELFQTQPLPQLPNLTKLRLSQVPSSLLNHFLNMYGSPKLERLSIAQPKNHDHLFTFDESISLPSLTYLAVPVRYEHCIWALEKTNWLANLETLFVKDISPDFVSQWRTKTNLEKLFGLISSKTVGAGGRVSRLKELNLEFRLSFEENNFLRGEDIATPVDLDPRLRLEGLPSLVTLNLTGVLFSFNTIDFILGLQGNLRELNVTLHEWNRAKGRYDDAEEAELAYQRAETGATTSKVAESDRFGVIQWVGFWSCMYTSNIWELMPMLDRIHIQFEAVPWQHLYGYWREEHPYNRAEWLKRKKEAEETNMPMRCGPVTLIYRRGPARDY